ncbi:MAG: aminotransferase class V-fold PLP-dependent enzyme [Candidatus Aminicenantes bacterium]|nr:aminotransferase class V-fold PLP-dependent enzyme [Candidatus Aminicenantes bacterium]NIM82757.1 aminotransferase class V-fold PLP-dependent enzyme [Candidatus Aminicenantes bacterium]NIN19321.1 aminotransferase class V-fold PLP-dependent enzyme [Candidatus Aminicenantes bacterium]NIN45893.1 aminotransferase class V-fold PLP-dependent enzyme [Candidatus Aminicenantes bacterium]NIN90865.1 aminotransferase class V-fold PLP-dependent enzyme [Candidatus Aminicenantes bacterium]
MYSRRQFLSRIALGGAVTFLALKDDALARVKEAVKTLGPGDSPEEIARNEHFWSRIQSAFQLDRTIINFNNGGVSPSPRTVHNALKRYLDYSNQNPAYNMWSHLEPNIEGVREKLALRFGCDKEEVAITRNASEALEIVQFGLNLQPGDEVIATTQAYPRMMTTWDQIVRRNKIVLKKVTFPVPLMDPNDYVKAIKGAITGKTKAIMVMHVINFTGQIAPVREVSRLAHSRGIPVICDGAHSFSHFPFTVKELECDFFGTSLHKWTYAPVGTGLLYVKRERIKELWPLMAAPEKMDDDIRKFEEIGTHPAANHNAIAEALAFNEAIGIDRKAARLRYLHLRWINRLRTYDNVKFMTNIDDLSQWCGLINVYIKGVDVQKLTDYLMNKHRILVIPIIHDEFKGIRVTPNVYTLLSEVDLFAGAMEKVAKGEVPEVMEGGKS